MMENNEANRIKLAKAVWETLTSDDLYDQFISLSIAQYKSDPDVFEEHFDVMYPNDNAGNKLREHYETLEVNGKEYEVYIHYKGNDPNKDPGKYFDVFDSDGCCINPNTTLHKPPIEEDVTDCIQRLNGGE